MADWSLVIFALAFSLFEEMVRIALFPSTRWGTAYEVDDGTRTIGTLTKNGLTTHSHSGQRQSIHQSPASLPVRAGLAIDQALPEPHTIAATFIFEAPRVLLTSFFRALPAGRLLA